MWYLKALLSNYIFAVFLCWTPPPVGPKIVFEKYFGPTGGGVQQRKTPKMQLLKSALRYHNQTFTTSRSHVKTTFQKIWRMLLEKWCCHVLDHFKLLKGVAASFFKVHPSNFVKSWLLIRSFTGKNLVVISQSTFE